MSAEKDISKKIRILLLEKEITVTDLARLIGKSRQWTSFVLHGHKKHQPTRQAIAAALGVPVVRLWPEKDQAA